MTQDVSGGYDEIAETYAAARSDIGADVISDWASDLPKGASVVDIGAGTGWPVSQALLDAGLTISAIEASPKLAAMFHERFPDIELVCEAAEMSDFFGRQFDGVVAIGLLFLLSQNEQEELVSRISAALKPGGRFLVSVPQQACQWTDVLTGRESCSLGEQAYRDLFSSAHMAVTTTFTDRGGNFYLSAVRL